MKTAIIIAQDITNDILEFVRGIASWLLLVPIAALALLLWLGGTAGLAESIGVSILVWLGIIVAGAAFRIAYLPIQYLRHKRAIRMFEGRATKAEAARQQGDLEGTRKCIRLLMKNSRDPREVPWWHWGV
jgi:hypothetical protein